MASEADSTEISSLFERLLRNRDMSLFLPFILGFTNMNRRESPENTDNPEQETTQIASDSSDRIILINPFTQGMVVIEGSSNLESLLRNMAIKDGQPPASKVSVEAMPSFEIGGDGEQMGDCVICLEEYEGGEMVKEMPCKHSFHDKCIDKWLGIHGSCPVCRYKMPVDKELSDNKRDREQRREIWVSFTINSGRRNGGVESDQTETATSTESTHHDDVSSSSSTSSRTDQEMEG